MQTRVRSLTLGSATFSTLAAFDAVICSFIALEDLVLDSICISNPPPPHWNNLVPLYFLPAAARRRPLVHLSITTCDALPALIGWTLARLDLSALRHLTLRSFLNRDINSIGVLLHSLPALDTLHLAPELVILHPLWRFSPLIAHIYHRPVDFDGLVRWLGPYITGLRLRALVFSMLPNTARSNTSIASLGAHGAVMRRARVKLVPALLRVLPPCTRRVEVRLYDPRDVEVFDFALADANIVADGRHKTLREVVVRAPGTSAEEAAVVRRAAGDSATWDARRRATVEVERRMGEDMGECRRAGILWVEWESDEGYVRRKVR